VSPAVHDVAAKKEGLGVWKEKFLQEVFANREASLEEMKETEARLLEEEHRKTHQVHVKTRGDMLVKYFSEKVSPAVHDKAAKQEGFASWTEELIHSDYAR
jgi:hypothetical protein